MTTIATYVRRSRPAVLATLAAAAAAIAFGAGDRAEPQNPDAPSERVALSADLGQLAYQIVVRSGADAASCRAATPRETTATIGVPTLVEAGNGYLPDLAMTLAAVPGAAGTTAVDLSVDRLPGSGVLRAEVQAVLAPVAGEPGRISFGYDGCEAGVPAAFDETITTSSTRLTLSTTTGQPLPALTLLGSEFTQASDGTRTESRAVSARMAPMPLSAHTSVNETAPGRVRREDPRGAGDERASAAQPDR